MADTITEVFFDVETKSFFDETGARDPSELGVSLVSVYRREVGENFKEIKGTMESFYEKDIPNMWPLFLDATRIVGFNTLHFDIPALKPYAPAYFAKLPHFDIVDEIRKVIGRRVSLNALAKATLGTQKNDTGANAIMYYRKGDAESLRLLKVYCEMDVELTRDIYDFVLAHKFLKFQDHWNTERKVELDFSYLASTDDSSQIGLF